MTKILLTSFLLLVFQPDTTQATIRIESVNKDIQTYARVDCSKFDDSFEKSERKIRTIRGKRHVNSLLSELATLTPFTDRSKTDARAIMTIRYSDHEETICADKFSIYRNGVCYKITDNLKKMIW